MRKILILFLLGIFFSGCATGLSNLQRRSLQSKDLDGSFDNVFKANITVLQDKGFIIDHTDFKAGIIHAETGVRQMFLSQYKFVITVTLEQFGENRVRERIVIIQNAIVSGAFGSKSEFSTVYDDPKMLQEIYEQIQKELFVRENLAK